MEVDENPKLPRVYAFYENSSLVKGHVRQDSPQREKGTFFTAEQRQKLLLISPKNIVALGAVVDGLDSFLGLPTFSPNKELQLQRKNDLKKTIKEIDKFAKSIVTLQDSLVASTSVKTNVVVERLLQDLQMLQEFLHLTDDHRKPGRPGRPIDEKARTIAKILVLYFRQHGLRPAYSEKSINYRFLKLLFEFLDMPKVDPKAIAKRAAQSEELQVDWRKRLSGL